MGVDLHVVAEETVFPLVGEKARPKAIAGVDSANDYIVHDHENHHYELDAAKDVFNLPFVSTALYVEA